MLYAQINPVNLQMIDSQKELPERFITSNGVTINRFNQLPQDVLKSLDWLPVIYEPKTEDSFYQDPPRYDAENRQFVYDAIPYDIELLRDDALQKIDQVASEVCAKYISQGVGQDARYLVKYAQALDYLKNIDNIDKHPMIKKEADASKMSYLDMANLIVKTANKWILIAAEIEAIRCSSKKKCKNATENADIIKLRDMTIAGLEAL